LSAAGVTGKYLPRVGSAGSLPLRVLGNLFGDGIAEPIIRGYTYLSRVWAAGDAVVITGFSRGATAARALAGFVVSHGLLEPSRYNPNDKAYKRAISAWYAYRQSKPDLAN
jgi:glutathione S-transferase